MPRSRSANPCSLVFTVFRTFAKASSKRIDARIAVAPTAAIGAVSPTVRPRPAPWSCRESRFIRFWNLRRPFSNSVGSIPRTMRSRPAFAIVDLECYHGAGLAPWQVTIPIARPSFELSLLLGISRMRAAALFRRAAAFILREIALPFQGLEQPAG